MWRHGRMNVISSNASGSSIVESQFRPFFKGFDLCCDAPNTLQLGHFMQTTIQNKKLYLGVCLYCILKLSLTYPNMDILIKPKLQTSSSKDECFMALQEAIPFSITINFSVEKTPHNTQWKPLISNGAHQKNRLPHRILLLLKEAIIFDLRKTTRDMVFDQWRFECN